MDDRLLQRYREYAGSEEALAVLFVKKYLARAEGHWVDVVDFQRYEMSSNNMHFRYVVGGLFKRKLLPTYPSRSSFTFRDKFDEHAFYLMSRAITWETAHRDIAQQKAKHVAPLEFEIEGVSFDKNKGRRGYFRDDAPPEVKALADHLEDRTNPLWDIAVQYVNAPEFVYKICSARVIPRDT